MSLELPNLVENATNNNFFRHVVLTTEHQQVVYMNLQPQEDIGKERHDSDQFILGVSGKGIVSINGIHKYILPGHGTIIPGKALHNVTNPSYSDSLKFIIIYSPPQHPQGEIMKYKN